MKCKNDILGLSKRQQGSVQIPRKTRSSQIQEQSILFLPENDKANSQGRQVYKVNTQTKPINQQNFTTEVQVLIMNDTNSLSIQTEEQAVKIKLLNKSPVMLKAHGWNSHQALGSRTCA